MDEHSKVVDQLKSLQSCGIAERGFAHAPGEIGELCRAVLDWSGHGDAAGFRFGHTWRQGLEKITQHRLKIVPLSRRIAMGMRLVQLPIGFAVDGQQGLGASEITGQKCFGCHGVVSGIDPKGEDGAVKRQAIWTTSLKDRGRQCCASGPASLKKFSGSGPQVVLG